MHEGVADIVSRFDVTVLGFNSAVDLSLFVSAVYAVLLNALSIYALRKRLAGRPA
jgi:hypothetical protein